MPVHLCPKLPPRRECPPPMSQFLGTHQNRLDPKGRVSVPAPFRTALKALDGEPALILRPSHNHPCIEAWPVSAFEALSRPMQGLDLFSADHDDMAFSLYGRACKIVADKDGRVILPEDLVEHAGLGETVVFIGLGRIFQVWEPAAAKAFQETARARANLRGLTLSQVNNGGAAA